MKKLPKTPDAGDKFVFGVLAFLGVGAIIGSFLETYEAGKEYGARQIIKRLKGNNDDHIER